MTNISDYAFKNCTGLTSVTIPNSVTSIDRYAFYGCSSLTGSLTIPNSVTSIGQSAFSDCSGLTSVNIPNSVTSIEVWAFQGCSSLTSVNIPNSITSIGYETFRGCSGLTSITIPNSVTSIGKSAFSDCSDLSSITIPNSVTSIGIYTFQGCSSLTSVTVEWDTPIGLGDSNTFSNASNATLYVPKGTKALYEAAYGWKEFKYIVEYSNDIDLADGTAFTNDEDKEVDELTYTRNFTNTNWQALYVPFEMQYEDWKDDFEVARINNVNQYDDDEDGNVDRTVLEVFKVKSGQTEAHTPYLIKAKTMGEKTISLTNATLYKAEEKSYDVSSWNTLYTFTGTYTGVSGATMFGEGYYALGGGSLHQAADATNALSPMRWYMAVTDRDGNPKNIGEVKVVVFGMDEDELIETGLEEVGRDAISTNEQPVFDLNGRRVTNSRKGLYIKNGKKFVVK